MTQKLFYDPVEIVHEPLSDEVIRRKALLPTR
jgi:hypothetical protein